MPSIVRVLPVQIRRAAKRASRLVKSLYYTAALANDVAVERLRLQDAVDAAILVGLVRHRRLARAEDDGGRRTQGRAQGRCIGEVGNGRGLGAFAGVLFAKLVDALDPCVLGRRV